MIVLSKKRIGLIVICILLGVVSFSIPFAKKNENTTNQTLGETTQVTATPVSGKVIVLDAGHGIPDEGAESTSRYNRS